MVHFVVLSIISIARFWSSHCKYVDGVEHVLFIRFWTSILAFSLQTINIEHFEKKYLTYHCCCQLNRLMEFNCIRCLQCRTTTKSCSNHQKLLRFQEKKWIIVARVLTIFFGIIKRISNQLEHKTSETGGNLSRSIREIFHQKSSRNGIRKFSDFKNIVP